MKGGVVGLTCIFAEKLAEEESLRGQLLLCLENALLPGCGLVLQEAVRKGNTDQHEDDDFPEHLRY